MVTPVILTYNEEPNIGATLESLAWAPRVVVVDSGSTDRTEEIAREYRNVSWFVRRFTDHASQWKFAVHETGIETEYVLALDADMQPSARFCEELATFIRTGQFAGAWISFEYRALGQTLLGSIYPAQIRLFRPHEVRIDQPGHTQVFSVHGPLYRFRSKFIHEDRKPLSRWLESQMAYASLEAHRIRTAQKNTLRDLLRRAGISPAVYGAYAYIKAGGPLRGRAARAYAHERLIFETILARLLAQTTKA
jgi:glycosyltransferase involved in cell wall biosynthesis